METAELELLYSAIFYTAEARRRISEAMESPALELQAVQELASIDAALRADVDRMKALVAQLDAPPRFER